MPFDDSGARRHPAARRRPGYGLQGDWRDELEAVATGNTLHFQRVVEERDPLLADVAALTRDMRSAEAAVARLFAGLRDRLEALVRP